MLNENSQAQYKYTIDVEFDWGGRTNETRGIDDGIPRIFEAFKKSGTRALFFVSTECLERSPFVVQQILSEGHEVGSHGHFHTIFKEKWRTENDRRISEAFLASHKSLSKKALEYRAPKFNFPASGSIYSNRERHVSLLKHMWLGQKIKEETIIYLHPFDIVGGTDAPNLFCKLWYSRPKKAYETLINLLKKESK